MRRLRDLARAVGDAALQWTLPPPDGTAAAGSGQRRVLLAGQPVAYTLTRSSRRTIGFHVDDAGLRVVAPRWVSLGDIEVALTEKAGWILRKQEEWQSHAARRAQQAIRWEEGGVFSLLGHEVRMTLETSARPTTVLEGETLRIGLAPGMGAADCRERVHLWLKQQARARFGERLPLYSARLGREPRRWALSSARTRWGSCSPDGSIRLNWRLIHFPIEVVDYVIAHELAHLEHMNHSPQFWATVARLYPDYTRARRALRDFPDDLVLS